MKCILSSLFTAGLKQFGKLPESRRHQLSKPNKHHLYRPIVNSSCGITASPPHIQGHICQSSHFPLRVLGSLFLTYEMKVNLGYHSRLHFLSSCKTRANFYLREAEAITTPCKTALFQSQS